MWTAKNEYGEIVYNGLTTSTAFRDLVPKLLDGQETIEHFKLPVPVGLYVDNCCTVKAQFLRMIPSLNQLKAHGVTDLPLPPHALRFFNLNLATHLDQFKIFLRDHVLSFLDNLPEESPRTVFGLDTEWQTLGGMGRVGRICTVQIAMMTENIGEI